MTLLEFLGVGMMFVLIIGLAKRFNIKPMKYDMSLTNTKHHGKFMTDNDLSLMNMNSDDSRWKS